MTSKCDSCDWEGDDDERETGVPLDFGDEIGGGDIDYFESNPQCCPQCGCMASSVVDE